MDSDDSDILGGNLFISHNVVASRYWSLTRVTVISVIVLFLIFGLLHVVAAYSRRRDVARRKLLRRRYGIPDHDNRPFPLAHADVMAERRKRETEQLREEEREKEREKEKLARSASLPRQSQPTTSERQSYTDPSIGPSTQKPDSVNIPSTRVEAHAPPRVSSGILVDQVRNTPRYDNIARASTSRPPAQGVHVPLRRKHSREEDVHPRSDNKRTRIEPNSVTSARPKQEDNWVDVGQDVSQPKRGAKRAATPQDDEVIEASRHDKRAKRAHSTESDEDASDEEMEDTSSPEVGQRGKKRLRGEESGSPDEEDGSGHEDDEESGRRRKRRSVSQKELELTHGKKRGRETDDEGSDSEDSDHPKKESRKKRGKKGHESTELAWGELSQNPLCQGRRVGEEWEVNGIQYKVGPKGQRLRSEIVKTCRPKFHMPGDSRHPDRGKNIQVYMQTWLSEEEYKAAIERRELAWQDTGDSESSVLFDINKGLFWEPGMSASPVPQGGHIAQQPPQQSVAPPVGLPLTPSPQPAATFSRRRIASWKQAAVEMEQPETESPKPKYKQIYSKWEKQNLEAAAMERMWTRQLVKGGAEAALTYAALAPAIPVIRLAPTAIQPAQPDQKPTSAPLPFGLGASTSAGTQPFAPVLNFPKSIPITTSATTAASTPAKVPQFGVPASSSTQTTPAAAPGAAQSSANASFASSAPQRPATSATPAASSSSSIPNFFGAKGAATANPFAPQQSATSAEPTASSSSSIPNFFGAKGAATANPFASISSLAGALGPTQTAPSSAFGVTSTPGASSSTPESSAPLPSVPIQPEQPEQPPQGPSKSLISRLGLTPPATEAAQTTPDASANTGFPSASSSTFGTSSASTPAPTAPAVAAPAPATPIPAPAAAPNTSTAGAPSEPAPGPWKFNFGFSKATPASTTPAPAAAATPPALAAEAAQSAPPTTSSASAEPAAPVKSAFGGNTASAFGASGNNPFGTTGSSAFGTTGGSAFGNAAGTAPVRSAFAPVSSSTPAPMESTSAPSSSSTPAPMESTSAPSSSTPTPAEPALPRIFTDMSDMPGYVPWVPDPTAADRPSRKTEKKPKKEKPPKPPSNLPPDLFKGTGDMVMKNPGLAAAIFGRSNTGTSTFGNVTPGTSAFGNMAAGTPAFGNVAAGTSAFGNVPAGTSAFGNVPAGTSAFGNVAAGTSAFGNVPTGTSAFGNVPTTSAFGNVPVGTSAFGNVAAGASAFGNVPAGTSAFGNVPAGTSAFGNVPTASAFGNVPAGTSAFGNVPPAWLSGTPASQNTPAATSSSAPATAAQPAVPAFGQPSTFGNPPQSNSPSAFGNTGAPSN